jgi:hypothetical protein
MNTTAVTQFERDLNNRLDYTINAMMGDSNWRKIFAHMSMKQIADTIARVFLSTALKPGKENADNFIKAFKAMMANK